MTEYIYNIDDGKFKTPSGGTPVPPFFVFGDTASFTLSFQNGVLEEGDVLTLAIDSNMEFYDPLSATGDASVMAFIHHQVASGEETSVELDVPLGTEVFRRRVNGRVVPLRVYVGLYVFHDNAYTELAIMEGFARPVVAGPEVVSPVLPVDTYPTRAEALQYVDLAESFAHGGTGKRDDEATDNAEYYKNGAETARDDAVVAKDDAVVAKDDAITAKNDAVTAKNAAVVAWSDAVAARNDAIIAKNVAVEQKNDAITAKDDAITAKNDAKSQADKASGFANDAKDAKDDAVRQAGLALNSAASAGAAKNAAVSAKNDSVSARDDAVSANNDAITAKNDAVTAKNAAIEAKNGAQSANESAQQAKSDAIDAKDDAISAKNDAVAAKDAAAITEEEIREDVQEARQILDELETRLSTAYIYGMDWKDADLQQNVAGKCIVLNNIYDNIQYDASLRYMQVESHGVLPAHNWKRCAMRTARSVNYYLHQSNSNMKADGTPAVLTGADGDILSEVDIVYFRVDKYTDSQNVNHTVWLCSDKPFNGSSPNPFFYVSPDGRTLRKQYVASFRSCVCDADGNTLNNNKTATADTTYQADKTYWSRSNNVFTKLTAGTDYTVGGTITQGSTVDTKIYENTVVASPTGFSDGRKYRSIVGALPAANATRAQFRSGHANNGFDSINFLWGSFMGIMMAIEYGTLSAQAKFSVGYSNLSDWNYKAMRLTGRTAIFGNNSGEIIADDIDAEGEDYDLLTMKNGGTLWNSTAQNNHAQRVVQCSYRGIEDPFGSQFTLDDGIQKNQDAIDLSITYNGLVYLRDEDDDPQTISLYCWKNGTTKFYTTSDTPSVGLNLYANTNLTTVTGTVAAVGEVTIVVGTTTYTRSSADDTTGHSYAWKNGDSVIYSHVVNPHTDANTREVFSDAQLTDKLGNVTSVVDDYSESGYWFTQSTNKYSYLDTDRGRLKGSEYVFPATGYTGEEAVWVHHEWPKASGYYCYFDTITFYPIYRAGNWGSATKGMCDYFYNDASAGARVVARLGYANYGSTDGPFYASTIYSLTYSHPNYGSRLAA